MDRRELLGRFISLGIGGAAVAMGVSEGKKTAQIYSDCEENKDVAEGIREATSEILNAKRRGDTDQVAELRDERLELETRDSKLTCDYSYGQNDPSPIIKAAGIIFAFPLIKMGLERRSESESMPSTANQ